MGLYLFSVTPRTFAVVDRGMAGYKYVNDKEESLAFKDMIDRGAHTSFITEIFRGLYHHNVI